MPRKEITTTVRFDQLPVSARSELLEFAGNARYLVVTRTLRYPLSRHRAWRAAQRDANKQPAPCSVVEMRR